MKRYAVGEVAEYLHPLAEVVKASEAQAEIDVLKQAIAIYIREETDYDEIETDEQAVEQFVLDYNEDNFLSYP